MKVINKMIKDFKLIYNDKDENTNTVLFYADFVNKIVLTNCGDFYYDYSIPFEDFIKFADYIKNRLQEMDDLEKAARLTCEEDS